jgi:hypothetical protein
MLRRTFCGNSIRWLATLMLVAAALYPLLDRQLAARRVASRLERVDSALQAGAGQHCSLALDPELSLRVQRLSPLLASWETVGGCGAGTSAGAGTVKWIGHGTTGGLFTDITQGNYTHLHSGPNYVLSTQVTRDINEQWSFGVFVPLLYKRYNDYMGQPVDISNSGLGDINVLGTFKFDPINATSLTATVGFPTGTHDATYKMDLLTQEKQLGIGLVTGSVTLDHTFDEQWGIIVLGGQASWRGGENELGNYRAPVASVYGYAGYFLGPLVPAIGLTLSGLPKPDRDRGIEQDVPIVLVAPNASIEWSTDWIAILLGVSLPIGLYAKPSGMVEGMKSAQSSTGLQPWTAALGISISPF